MSNIAAPAVHMVEPYAPRVWELSGSSKRALIGMVFVLHGLAHSGLGMWSTSAGNSMLAVPAWWLAEVGFLVGGFGLIGVPWCRRVWEQSAVIAAVASIVLLQTFGHVALAFGLMLDVLILVLGLRWGESTLLGGTGGQAHASRKRDTLAHRLMFALATCLVVYVAIVVAARPWHTRWGTSAAERSTVLPGDDGGAIPTYRIDHAVNVHAPADSVWQWLAQIGQDRGGFYSYDRLERLVGADIHNAARVHPEWQERQQGDLVRATQAGYLGGIFGTDPGWRVAAVVPGRALVLRGWGAFNVLPVDARTSRVYVRTRGYNSPDISGTVLAPFGLLVFEPVHFMMERAMLLGIKARAEHGRME